MPVGAEAAGYGGSALAYITGRPAYDVGDADLFETTTSRQELLETRRTNRVRAVICCRVILLLYSISLLILFNYFFICSIP